MCLQGSSRATLHTFDVELASQYSHPGWVLGLLYYYTYNSFHSIQISICLRHTPSLFKNDERLISSPIPGMSYLCIMLSKLPAGK